MLHNLTPHIVRVFTSTTIHPAPGVSEYPSEGVARVAQSSQVIDIVDACDVATPLYGAVVGLPEPQDGHHYIVSMVVAQALPQRRDLLWPDSGPDAVRRDGQIWAVRRLLRTAE